MPMNAAAEFFQCGDVAVTTNGVSRTIPRELPFAHDGYGQDDEWVAANFTNATEIAAAGGLGDWNGAAKLTPTVTVEDGEGATMRFKVTPGDGTAPRAFLRIRALCGRKGALI